MSSPPPDGELVLGPKLSPKAIGRLLRSLREAAGVTQVDLGKMLGTPYQNISRMETGAREPMLSTINRYVRALGYELVVSTRPRQDI